MADGEFNVFLAEIPEGADAKSITISFEKKSGLLFSGKKSLYGTIFTPDGKRWKIMVSRNKYFKGEPSEFSEGVVPSENVKTPNFG